MGAVVFIRGSVRIIRGRLGIEQRWIYRDRGAMFLWLWGGRAACEWEVRSEWVMTQEGSTRA